MSTDDVSVSLSRLALAKAIKTPDSGEDDAEPWSKSIIFHQAHIDPQMRYSIEHPQHQQQQQHNRRRGPTKNASHGRHSHVYPQQQQETKRLVTPPMHRARSDEMHKHKQPATERLSSHSASSGSAERSSLSSTKLTNSKPTRRFVPSDDEEEEEEEDNNEESEEEEDNDEEVDEKKAVIEKSEDDKEQLKSIHELPAPTEAKKNKGKAPNRLPQPSDDEEEDENDNSNSSDDDQDVLSSPNGDQLYARRMSTLRQLERGSSVHRRAKSLGDMNHMIVPSPPVETETLGVAPSQEMGTIEEWCKTVMEEAEGTTNATLTSNHSSLPDESGDQTIEKPAIPTPNIQGTKAQNRRSMLSDMDMYYYQQQQQQQQMAFQNMQMQQAMQLQQAQQMAQIQQYQQMMQMQQLQQQQLMPNYNDTRKNRKSMSAMDLMIQLEEEKAASRKTNKKKPLDPSKASLDEGLLSKVPQQGLHNISFQGQNKATKKAIQRASKSDYNIQGNRPPSASYSRSNTPMDPRMRSQMIRSESSPIPSLNMSTPMNQYLVPPQMVMQQQQQQQQLGMPQMMVPSKSTGRLSYQSSNRLSGNWGGYNKQ